MVSKLKSGLECILFILYSILDEIWPKAVYGNHFTNSPKIVAMDKMKTMVHKESDEEICSFFSSLLLQYEGTIYIGECINHP